MFEHADSPFSSHSVPENPGLQVQLPPEQVPWPLQALLWHGSASGRQQMFSTTAGRFAGNTMTGEEPHGAGHTSNHTACVHNLK
jgi:hypothetical protein